MERSPPVQASRTSRRLAPSANTSPRTVSGSPSNSSGAAKRGVRPSTRAPRGPQVVASPRSTSVAVPSGRTITLAGLMSPWSMPARCSCVSWMAAPSSARVATRSPPPRSSNDCRLAPSTSSRTRNGRPSARRPNRSTPGNRLPVLVERSRRVVASRTSAATSCGSEAARGQDLQREHTTVEPIAHLPHLTATAGAEPTDRLVRGKGSALPAPIAGVPTAGAGSLAPPDAVIEGLRTRSWLRRRRRSP